jgi:hypothetical protein
MTGSTPRFSRFPKVTNGEAAHSVFDAPLFLVTPWMRAAAFYTLFDARTTNTTNQLVDVAERAELTAGGSTQAV